MNVKQEKNETLQTFMEQFGKMMLKIKNLSPEVALHHTVTTLKPGHFSDSLCKKKTANPDELRRRATKYIELEELKEFRKQIQDEMSQKLTTDNQVDRNRFAKHNQKPRNVYLRSLDLKNMHI